MKWLPFFSLCLRFVFLLSSSQNDVATVLSYFCENSDPYKTVKVLTILIVDKLRVCSLQVSSPFPSPVRMAPYFTQKGKMFS